MQTLLEKEAGYKKQQSLTGMAAHLKKIK